MTVRHSIIRDGRILENGPGDVVLDLAPVGG